MTYHKIHTMFKRDKKDAMMLGEWTDPIFEYLQENKWRCTEKIDGTNIRVTIDPISEAIRSIGQAEVRFDGRTDNALLPAKLVNWMAGKFFDKTMLQTLKEKFPDGAILYGEGCGDGIGKMGAHYGPQQGFVLFDVRVGDWWLQRDAVNDVAETLGLRSVKDVGYFTLHEAIELVEKGYHSEFGDFLAEGLIAEPCVPMFNRKGERVITKIKTRDFKNVVTP
jgi:hypothetical protein